MPTAVFQSWYDVTIKTFITGYVPRVAGWKFNYGSLWPHTSGTKLFNAGGGNSGISGAWCDVFYRKGSVGQFGGLIGQTSLNEWGDLTPASATGNFNPAYYNGRVKGVSWVGQNPITTVISGWNYGIDLAANSNYPTTLGVLPSQINPKLIATAFAPIIPSFMFGGSVPQFNYDIYSGFYIPAAPVDMIDNNGLITHINGNSARQISGIAPGRNLALYNNGAIDCLVNLAPVVGAPIIITWDDATVNTTLQDAGAAGTGLQRSTITPFGYLSFLLGNFTLAARLVTNPMILTSFDGTQYWGIAMTAGDAAATTALGGAGSARTGHMTPDGLFWFQNSLQASIEDKVFAGFITALAPGLTMPIAGLIPMPNTPNLDGPFNPNPWR